MIEALTGIRTLNLQKSDLRRLAKELIETDSLAGFAENRISDETVLKMIRAQNDELDERQLTLSRLVKDAANARGIHPDLEKDLQVDQNGREQVSEHFWRKIVSNLSGLPWAFICNYAENEASAIHNDVFGVSYGFHENVTTWRGLVAAGAGSYVVFYNTSNAPNSKMSYSSFARIEEIEESKDLDSNGRRNWKAKLSDFHVLRPVTRDLITIDGRNPQHGIQAITFSTFQQIIELGDGSSYVAPAEKTARDQMYVDEKRPSYEDVLSHGPALDEVKPNLQVVEPRELDQSMSEREFQVDRSVSNSRTSSRNLDKQTETRAVEIVLAYLTRQGWRVLHDNQRDGIGYDFEFGKGDESLLIEIKGIRGSRLEFNMTAREFFVCSTRENFRLIAVTHALKADDYRIHVLFPSDIFQMKRRVTQYRFSPFNEIG